MNKNYLLFGLLAIQVVAAFLVLSGGRELQNHTGIQKLLAFDPEQIDGIRIEDRGGQISELKREGDTWLTNDGFPADANRVDRLLGQLDGLEHGLAVARSNSAAKRFEVEKDQFERNLQLIENGKPVVELYLGSGAGARRSHVRLADQDAIYAANIGSFDLPTEIGDWQDKELLQINIEQIESVAMDDLTIRKVNTTEKEAEETTDTAVWIAESLTKDEQFQADEFESQLRSLANLRYNRALNKATDKLTSEARFSVVYDGSTTRDYEFFKAEEGDQFWLKVSDYDELFELSQYNGNRIIENLTRAKLIEKPAVNNEALADESAEETQRSVEAKEGEAEAFP